MESMSMGITGFSFERIPRSLLRVDRGRIPLGFAVSPFVRGIVRIIPALFHIINGMTGSGEGMPAMR